MKCATCIRPAIPRSIYCPRCRELVAKKAESIKRRAALIAAYDEAFDAFRCHWSRVILVLDDTNSPFHICFDHLIPRKSSTLVASSELFNEMKSDLGPEEFPRAFIELARHHRGLPFNRDFIKFIFWRERKLLLAPPMLGRRLRHEEWTSRASSECDICGHPSYKHSIYCQRCRRFVFWGGHDHLPRVKALKEAWNPELDAFICHYTGVKLDDSDPKSPWYINFDHRIPGDENTQTVAASWVNAMKTDLSEDEFWAVVMEYDRYLREGGEFNAKVTSFKYWNRSGP